MIDYSSHLDREWTKPSCNGQKPGGAEHDSIVDMKERQNVPKAPMIVNSWSFQSHQPFPTLLKFSVIL